MAYTVFPAPQMLPRFTKQSLNASEWLSDTHVLYRRSAWRAIWQSRDEKVRKPRSQASGAAAITAPVPRVIEIENAPVELRSRKPGVCRKIGREGPEQATDTSMMAANGVGRSSSAVADCAQEIITAWSRYAEEVMGRSSEASRALLRPRKPQ